MKNEDKKTTEIRITIPQSLTPAVVHRVKHRYQSLTPRKKRATKVTGTIFFVAVVATLSVFVLGSLYQKSTLTSENDFSSSSTQKTPDYATILPEGKTIEQLGGWTRVSPPDRNPVFAYIDTINGKTINISQQPLPAEFKQDTNSQIEQLASGYKATEKVTVGEVTVFIGSSAKGPQSVIFTKNNLLILIKSSVPLTEDEWAGYVKSLI
ncbi:MAG: hypothetical protein WAO28_02430 [Candidatus Microsaccharimonas sp.]